jgi:hypothetical protein
VRFGRSAPWDAQRVFIAERFPGWPLEYVDGLSWPDLIGVCTVIKAEDKAKSDELEAIQWHGSQK